jgi:hypothetical protein
MAVDLGRPRHDITYLTRRLKPGEVVAAAPKSAPVSLRLNLSSPGEAYDDSLPAKPQADGRTVLTADAPVVRLNSRQSAIGSLVVTGADVFGWQGANRENGVVSKNVNTPQQFTVPSFGNRPLVEFTEGKLVLGLRHFRELRRLVIGGATGSLTITLLDETEVVLDTLGGTWVFYLSVINHEIEIRAEELIGSIDETFSITQPAS